MKRGTNPRSLENLELGAKARYKGKVRRNATLLPETIQWLEERGNASEMIDLLVASAKNGSLKFNPDISDNAHSSNDQQNSNDAHNSNQADLQLAALKQENAQLRLQVDEQAKKASEWYEKAQVLTAGLDKVSRANQANLEAIRDRVLAGLRLGRQAPGYKATAKALDRLIADFREGTL